MSSPTVWVAERSEAEVVARLMVAFRDHLGYDWPSDNAFLAGVEGLMDDMCQFLGHEMTPKLRETIKKRGDKQRKYESEHKYDLAKFGLTEEQIRRDCAFFYDEFLPPMALPAPAATARRKSTRPSSCDDRAHA